MATMFTLPDMKAALETRHPIWPNLFTLTFHQCVSGIRLPLNEKMQQPLEKGGAKSHITLFIQVLSRNINVTSSSDLVDFLLLP